MTEKWTLATLIIILITGGSDGKSSGRSIPMLDDLCQRFPDNPLCTPARETVVPAIPKTFLTGGRKSDCSKYQLHYSYWCTSLTETDDVKVEEFCGKYATICDSEKAPSIIPRRLTQAECLQHQSLAQRACGPNAPMSRKYRQLCDLYAKSCSQYGISITTRKAKISVTTKKPQTRDLSWLDSYKDNIAIGASSMIKKRMALAENCNKNMDLYKQFCMSNQAGRKKRNVASVLSNAGSSGQQDFERVCSLYADKAAKHCNGNEEGAAKVYCDYYRKYCTKYSNNNRPGGQRTVQKTVQNRTSTIQRQTSKSQDTLSAKEVQKFCENFAQACNTVGNSQQIGVLKKCQDYHHLRGNLCFALSLQADRVACNIYRKYCMGLPPLLDIDGIPI